jgi:hypothetical protein
MVAQANKPAGILPALDLGLRPSRVAASCSNVAGQRREVAHKLNNQGTRQRRMEPPALFQFLEFRFFLPGFSPASGKIGFEIFLLPLPAF